MEQRGAITDRLADVIRIAQFMRKSGVLVVERGEVGITFEEGAITFVEGQVMDAKAGQRSGMAAFQWLNEWNTCRFTFIPLQPSPALQHNPIANQVTAHSLPSAGGAVLYHHRRDAREVLPLFSSLGLTRVHRQLFLLINGQRSVPELVRLLARDAEEVHALLTDLERAGLIRR